MLVLYRYYENAERTQGLLLLDGKWIADTLEKPWRGNERFVSCIPEGLYRLRWNSKDHAWPCYEVGESDHTGVSGRDGILIHPANSASELEGCIALGHKYGDQLWNSTFTLESVHSLVGDRMSILITNKFGG